MSLLDEKAKADLLSRITSDAPQPQPEQNSQSLETTNARPEQSEKQREPLSQEEHKVEQSIPYDRFKKVNDSKKEYQKKAEDQQREIERLRKELETKSSSQDDNWLEELLGEEKKPEKSDEKLSSLEQRLRKFELVEAEKELGNIVKNAVAKHSDLDSDLVESVIYQTIGEDPNADVEEAIETMRQFITYVNVKGKKQSTPQKQVAPRPSMTANKTYTETISEKPRSLADAKSALYNFLKTNKL